MCMLSRQDGPVKLLTLQPVASQYSRSLALRSAAMVHWPLKPDGGAYIHTCSGSSFQTPTRVGPLQVRMHSCTWSGPLLTELFAYLQVETDTAFSSEGVRLYP